MKNKTYPKSKQCHSVELWLERSLLAIWWHSKGILTLNVLGWKVCDVLGERTTLSNLIESLIGVLSVLLFDNIIFEVCNSSCSHLKGLFDFCMSNIIL